jgi:hypothetical protein
VLPTPTFITANNEGSGGSTSLYANPRRPGGGLSTPYFPVNRPRAKGEYAMSLMPSSSHVSRVPFVSMVRVDPHEHRLDEDEIPPRHWFTRTGLTNGRHAKLHKTLPGNRLSRWYCTCSVAMGTPRTLMYLWILRSCFGP